MACVMRVVPRWSGWLHATSCRISKSRFVTDASAVETWTDGKVRLIGLNRPEQRNAVDSHTATILFEAFKEFNSDESVHSAVLFGRGGNFCAGYDLKELAGSEEQGRDLTKSFRGTLDVEKSPSPMV